MIGQDEGTARSQLSSAGFQVAVNQVTSDQPQGQVVDQSPAGGSQAPKGSTVTIAVSKGPQTKAVPNVVGDEQQVAKQRLEAAGFTVNVVQQDTTDPTQDKIVISQDPTGGSQAQPGSTVTITVGKFTGGGGG